MFDREESTQITSAEEPMSVDETMSETSSRHNEKKMNQLAESIRCMQEQQSAMAMSVQTLMMTVQTLYFKELTNETSGKKIKCKRSHSEEGSKAKSEDQAQVSSTDMEPISIANDIEVLGATMCKKNRTQIKREFQRLYDTHDSHAQVKAGLKARFEELYTNLQANVEILPCANQIDYQPKLKPCLERSDPFIYMSFKIDYQPYEVLIQGKKK